MNKVLTVLSAIVLLLISCGEKEKVVEVPVASDIPPAPPVGLVAINLEGAVQLCWLPNVENNVYGDVVGYDVYWWDALNSEYAPIGTVLKTTPEPFEYCFTDEPLTNGVQNFYAVAAYDKNNKSSDLSYFDVSGTPRPEGSVTLNDRNSLPAQSGYYLAGLSSMSQSYLAPSTDFYYEFSGGTNLFIVSKAGDDIQDYGYVGDFYGINRSPVNGWSPTGTAEAIAGHIFFVRLADGSHYHYAKLYVTEATSTSVTFRWAYQTAQDNIDLAPPAPGRGAGPRTSMNLDEAKPGLNLASRSTNVSATPPIVETGNMDTGTRFEQQTTH
jgi:hypothetical protein